MNKINIVMFFILFSFSVNSNELNLVVTVIDNDNLLVTLLHNNADDIYEKIKVNNKLLCREPVGGLEFLLESNKDVYRESSYINERCDVLESVLLSSSMGISKVFNYSSVMKSTFILDNGSNSINSYYNFKAKICFLDEKINKCIVSNSLAVTVKDGVLSFDKTKIKGVQ